MVVFDASILVLLLHPHAAAPIDPTTGKPVIGCKDRLELLIDTLERDRTRVIIPTPALSEVLVGAGAAAPAVLDLLGNSARFRIASFDTRAAVELA